MIIPSQAELVPTIPRQELIDHIDATLAAEYEAGKTVVVSISGSKKIVVDVVAGYQSIGWTVKALNETDYEFSA